MRIDPSSVFVHSTLALPARILLLWILISLGVLVSVFIGSGFGAFEGFSFIFLGLPFFLLTVAIFSGWWSLIAIPLLIALFWTGIRYLREEGSPSSLLRIFLFSLLITIRFSQDLWLLAALIAIGTTFLIFKIDRNEPVAY